LVQIDEDIMRLIIKQNYVVLIGSVSPDGIPNISPRYVLAVLKDGKLLFADAFENKTFQNIDKWPKVTAAVFDRDTHGGYQLKGEAETITDPKLAAEAEARLKEFGISEKPKRVWVLSVKEVFSLEPSAKSKNQISYFR
jgi:predicted pyridoxine 5'-phosphate oxidase superfamily flavin-nucleotide-binding protein